MKPETVLVCIVICMILGVGCTSQDEPVTPSQVQQTITPVSVFSATPAVTPAPQAVTTVPVTPTKSPVRIFNGEYRWVEYRENSSTLMPPNPRSSWIYNHRLERSVENFRGIPAVHQKITTISDYPECCIDNVVTITQDGRVNVEDTWFDASTGRCLGGTLTGTIKGTIQPSEEIPEDKSLADAGDRYGGWMGIIPFREVNMALADEGTEPVTVPLGTIPDAHRYTGNFHDGTLITFWVAPGIPVPIRYEYSNKYLDGIDPIQVFELKGWG